MLSLLPRLKSRLEKYAISACPRLDFLPHPTTPSPRGIKAPPKNKNWQSIAFCTPPHRFSTQSSQYQNKKAKAYSVQTVTELRLPVSESSTRSRNFMSSTDSKHKFHKTEIEIWPSIGFKLGSSWLGTLSHNLSTMFVQPLKSWNNPGDILLSWKCASVIKSHLPSLRVASTPNKTKSNQHGLNHLQTLHKHTHTHTHTRIHTKLRLLARRRCEWKPSNPWGDKRKSWTCLPFSFHLIDTRNKKMKP